MKNLGWTLLFLSLIIACSKKPYETTNRLYRKQVQEYAKILSEYPLKDSLGFAPPQYQNATWVGTTNFNMRKPNFVVIHHTAQDSCAQTLRTFTLERTKVSAHYVICRDGMVHHMLNDYLRAWHAGIGRWGNVTDMNAVSIGIELDNNGSEPFPEPMMQSLYKLLENLKKTYSIPTANFIGHADLAPTRKNDPSVYFDWREMAHRGFGLWYDDTTGIVLPTDFNALQAFRIIGYDLKDTTAVIRTFKQKYLKETKSRSLTEGDKKVLYQVMKKFL
jgi:N-acetylmuramoyl-L-alanine amidase